MLIARDIRVVFPDTGRAVLAGASLDLEPGEVVGLGGPSGTGKSTLARVLTGHIAPDSGTVTVDGAPLPEDGYRPVQLLFQSPELAVNPRWRIRDILCEAYRPETSLLGALGIRDSWASRYPHELSGGELQRVAIARALSPRTRYLVADEISGMLDAITQAEIWRLLLDLVRVRRVGMLVISHDAALLDRIAGRRLALVNGLCEPALGAAAERNARGVLEPA
jgi:peptide/nickel transport system ATP-binding protein